ncbi:hypothetical protein H4582DRAFT_2077280 [Lactarius indigo]|nr:hypothetical protein H4582DRAFT_2077280 [Lactarius indigo]
MSLQTRCYDFGTRFLNNVKAKATLLVTKFYGFEIGEAAEILNRNTEKAQNLKIDTAFKQPLQPLVARLSPVYSPSSQHPYMSPHQQQSLIPHLRAEAQPTIGIIPSTSHGLGALRAPFVDPKPKHGSCAGD